MITGAGYGLVALGLVLIYKSSGVFNFAQGEFGTVAVYALYGAHDEAGIPLLPAMLIGLAAAVAMALATERLIVRPLFDAPRVTLLVATAGVSLLAISLELWLGEARAPVHPTGPRPARPRVGLRHPGVRPAACWCWPPCCMLAVLLGLFFSRTNLGLAILGVSQEPVATELMGISVRRLSSFIWGAHRPPRPASPGCSPRRWSGSFGPGFLTVDRADPGLHRRRARRDDEPARGVRRRRRRRSGPEPGGERADPLEDIPGPGAVMVFVLLVVVLAVRPQGLLGKTS